MIYLYLLAINDSVKSACAGVNIADVCRRITESKWPKYRYIGNVSYHTRIGTSYSPTLFRYMPLPPMYQYICY